MISLLSQGGFRPSEVANIQLDAVSFARWDIDSAGGLVQASV